MNDVLFVQYPACSTCKRAKLWLETNSVLYTDRNIKEANPTKDELIKWYSMSGQTLKKFFNTSGLVYKSLNLKDKLPSMSDDEKLELLSSDGMLVKRPLLILNDKVLIGFKEEEWKAALKI